MSFLNNAAAKQSVRLLRHELKRGELTIVFLALVLAVATVFSLTGFSNQIKSALIIQSSSFIAADRVLETSRKIDPLIIQKSTTLNLQHVQQIVMSSMVFAANDDQKADPSTMLLASLTATSDLYPLRGELLVSTTAEQLVNKQSQLVHAPNKNEVWVDKKVLTNLKVKLGEHLEIGIKKFVIAGVIQQLPDNSFSIFSAGPKIILNITDIYATDLIQPASRIGYKYLFAGDNKDIEQFSTWIKPQLNNTQRFYGIKSRQNALAKVLNRAEKYLSLASMLGIVLAAVAVAVGARRYSHRHQVNVAVFKAMGASRAYVSNLYLLHWSLLSIAGILVGLIAGYFIQLFGLLAMAEYLPNTATNNLIEPLFIAIVTGLICAVAFAISPLIELFNTSPLAVVRSVKQTKPKLISWQQVPAFSALLGLLMMFSGDWKLSLILLASGLIIVVILLLFARLMMSLGRGVGSKAGQAWQLALANLKRNASENSVQLVSFTIAIQLLLLLLVVRNELLADWQAQLPETAANRFLINISKSQVDEVKKFTQQNNLVASAVYPVIPGRLTAVNNEKISNVNDPSVAQNSSQKSSLKESTLKENAIKENSAVDNNKANITRRGIGRELNLTWQDLLPEKNKLIAGKWWQASDSNAQVSIEEKLAQRLDIKLGDKLTFQLGSDIFDVEVTSIRTVNWQSMQPNFYMIFNQQVLQDFPATFIASLFVPELQQQKFSSFIAKYPTITVLDVDAMINQLRKVIKQVSIAIEFILILVVLAGSLVLVAQVQATMEERQRNLAILRTLGARGVLLRISVLYEFIALGVMAGFLASCAMEVAVYFLQTKVFAMAASFHFKFWLLGMGSGGLFVGLIGLFSCWRLLTKTALHRHVV